MGKGERSGHANLHLRTAQYVELPQWGIPQGNLSNLLITFLETNLGQTYEVNAKVKHFQGIVCYNKKKKKCL